MHKNWQLVAFAFALAPAASNQALAQVEVVTGVVAARELRGQIDSLITSARQDADLMVFNAAVQARDALDAWERANSSTIDRAFDRMDKAQQDLFSNIQSAVDDINAKTADRLAQAQQVTDTVLLAVNRLPTNKYALIASYGPKVIFPGGTESTTLRLKGPNLDRAKVSVRLPDGSIIKPIDLTATDASFVIPSSILLNADGTSRPLTLQVSYLSRPFAWFNKKQVEQPITPWIMPSQLGQYTAVPTVTVETIERKTQVFNTGRMSGRNKNVFKGINPPSGWKFDLSRINEATVSGDGGEAGRCQQIAPNDRSENGLLVQGRVDEIKEFHFPNYSYDDGWIRCNATIPIYRIVRTESSGSQQSGSLDWYSSIRITAPADTTGWTVTMRTFDNRTLTFTGNGQDRYIRLTKDTGGLVITPIRPEVR